MPGAKAGRTLRLPNLSRRSTVHTAMAPRIFKYCLKSKKLCFSNFRFFQFDFAIQFLNATSQLHPHSSNPCQPPPPLHSDLKNPNSENEPNFYRKVHYFKCFLSADFIFSTPKTQTNSREPIYPLGSGLIFTVLYVIPASTTTEFWDKRRNNCLINIFIFRISQINPQSFQRENKAYEGLVLF